MKLFIDTSDSRKVRVGFGSKIKELPAYQNKSQVLLLAVANLVGNNLKEIKEIEVNPGPGSFTGLRVGVAVGNALGFALRVPVNGKDVLKEGGVVPFYE